jgi:hypothetical protein
MQQEYVTKEEFIKLQTTVDALSQSFYKNNFSSSQTFNKDSVFTTRLNVPSYSTPPSVAEVNDLIGIAGVLYICTVAGSVASPATFTLVGSQI